MQTLDKETENISKKPEQIPISKIRKKPIQSYRHIVSIGIDKFWEMSAWDKKTYKIKHRQTEEDLVGRRDGHISIGKKCLERDSPNWTWTRNYVPSRDRR